MVRFFNPYEHFGRPDIAVIKEINVSSTERLHDAVNKVRAYLRDEHSQSFAKSIIDPGVREEIKTVIADYLTPRRSLHIPGISLESLIKTVQQEILYFGPIQKALDDPAVTNIEINTPRDVYIERNGEEEYRPDLGFKDEEHLFNVINKMLIPLGKTLTANEPHVDSLFENCRICAVLKAERGGIATESTCLSIRKFSDDTISPDELVRLGTISQEMEDFFRDVIPSANVIIGGATNSGKTTTLSAIPLFFPENTRVITIEDSPEMMLRRKKAFRNYRNLVALQTKHHENQEKRYDIARLTRVSLRMRPMKIIVGEVRDGAAARQTHEAMNTGHNCYSTLHASSARNAATRIVQLAGDGYNDEAIAAQLADTVDLILFQQKIRKSRIITEVVELRGFEGAKHPICTTIFEFVQDGITGDGYVKGKHRRVNPISQELAARMRANLVPEENIRRWLGVKNQEGVSPECCL
ncbi:MAG: ATPase, T2SS/T4P/T4SS family [Peptococcaceae bacterium]|jgi:pilus assembly protein CpaF|nr:ATPase, T2SS/T4P/T4SS family [Peptococcaceae bacterium]MDH7526459.1 ATPase, T2SS/T4P/T4SS family [Peptococcaceae bacterium]